MDLVDRIKLTAKLKKNWNLKTTAQHAGIGVNSIYRWKMQAPRADKLLQVAEALDVSLDYLMGRSEDSQIQNHPVSMTIEEAIDGIRYFNGEPVTDFKRRGLKAIAKAYLRKD
ncbi:helix-turn-helix domain-containing protein [Pediococcus acidilactici]|uniref:Transcriptional regulator n=1 Tax=Pediococcus acidilactici TaxID=1254 RepID=A0AAW8YEI6_PEDAC|nr:helix-turn-helix domain-containing protein [Pediococcus acidilactici]MDD9323768.1 transcriptional regulator [Pediococcus acidilactici]MDV2620128.1 transcriptional regulator [Pediococcus acidilactici]NBI14570.1 transcriptional regulator [Pediococcus acidilactici]NFA44651.1 transcriptional regulator [Pediococcus acidilactici]NFA47507.1 transcriptional regulator [Pediococcus acidilactici]